MNMSLALFAQLAAACAPSVHVDTLAAIAHTESRFSANALYDNTARRSYRAPSREQAVVLATELVTVQRHSVDLGLMQVNSANLAGLGLSIAQAFEPCHNLGAGARVLTASYKPPAAGQDVQPALLQALSRYNTGHPARGFGNGYVAKVVASAEQVVPAIRLGQTGAAGLQKSMAPAEPNKLDKAFSAALPPPPSWDVFARARYERAQPNGSRPPATSASPGAPPFQPPFQLPAQRSFVQPTP